jgi:Cof subfamily protein (haloacid dehalogenase superfamily)
VTEVRAQRASNSPKLVATDLDGTLLDGRGELSERTRTVLDRLDEAGVPLVVVTARPLRWMTELWPVVGRHGIGIVSNGAIVYDVAEGRVHELQGIDVEAGLALVGAIRAAVPAATFALERESGFAYEPAYDEQHHIPDGAPSGPAEELLSGTTVKVLVKAPGTDPAELRRVVTDAVGDTATATWSVEGLVEISAAGVTKAAALARVCDRLGIAAADVVAFGDMPNDLAMLKWAGTSYAVANAHPSVLAAVDRVAASNDDDGVADALALIYALDA